MMNERITIKPSSKQKAIKYGFISFEVMFLALVLILTYIPIIVMFLTSFSADPLGYRFNSFTTKWYQEFVNNETLIEAVTFTLKITLLSTLISTVFGTFAAIGINSLNKNLKKKVIILNNVPILNADIVTGAFLLLVFRVLSVILGINIIAKYGFYTTLIAHVLFSTPYVVLSVLPKLSKDNSLYEAACDLGCSPFQALFKVIIPNIKSGIFSGAMLAFTMSIDDFIITHFISGDNNNFSTWLYGSLKTIKGGAWNQACCYNSILILITFIFVMGYNIISSKNDNKKQGV